MHKTFFFEFAAKYAKVIGPSVFLQASQMAVSRGYHFNDFAANKLDRLTLASVLAAGQMQYFFVTVDVSK
jgi:hypothetical protein